MTPVESPDHMIMGIIFLTIAVGWFGGMAVYLFPDKVTRAIIWARIVHVVLTLTLWLWFPWVCLGVRTVWRHNMAAVNDTPPAEIVMPPTVPVRPSAADLPEVQP